jgi:hypothetical protein
MNTQKSSTTPYIIIAIVVIIGVMVYLYWNGTKVPDSTTLEQTNGSDIAVGADVFKLLSEINSLKIDSTFFNDSTYKSLRDFTVDIPTLPIGRSNPFAPLPGVLSPGSAAGH